ncbi:Ycf48-like protein [anaerobic digester metagenome]
MKQTFFIFLMALNMATYAQWTVQNSGTTEWLRGVDFVNADTGIAVGYNGTVLRTTDGGATWSLIDAGVTSDLLSVRFLNNLTCFITGAPGILRSGDGGLTWVPVKSGWKYFNTFFVNDNIGYACGQMGMIAKTTDGGLTWSDSSTFNADMVALYFNNPDTGFVVTLGWTDAIRKTTDGGGTWTGIHSNTIAEYASVVFTSDDTGYVCSTGAVDRNILKTTDAGNTWNVVFTTPSGGLYDIEFPAKETGYVAGGFQNASTIFKSTDAGLTWEGQYTNTTSPLFSCSFVTENLGYAVGINGTIIKTINGGVGTDEFSKPLLFSVYPNPATDFLNIELAENAVSSTEVTICDMAGRTILFTTLQKNESIDLRSFSAGAYLLKIKSDQQTGTSILIKE